MSRKLVGTLLLLLASLTFGVLASERFYSLFLGAVPPLALSTISQSASHGMFLVYGAVLGVSLFAFALLAIVLARFFRDVERD